MAQVDRVLGAGDSDTILDGNVKIYQVAADLTVTVPESGDATATVEYSVDALETVLGEQATWTVWPAEGNANTAYTWAYVVTRVPMFFRVTASGADGHITVTAPTTTDTGGIFYRITSDLATTTQTLTATNAQDFSGDGPLVLPADVTSYDAQGAAIWTLGAGTNGTKIGASAADLFAFHGAAPCDQAALVADPSGGATQDAEARAAIVSILDVLIEKGLMAST